MLEEFQVEVTSSPDVLFLDAERTARQPGYDLHRPIRKQFEDALLDERLVDSFELSKLELRPEVVKDRIAEGEPSEISQR